MIDDVKMDMPREFRAFWRLADHDWVLDTKSTTASCCIEGTPYSIHVQGSSSPLLSLTRAQPESDAGWWSPFYDALEPAQGLLARFNAGTKFWVKTVFQPIEKCIS